MDNATDFELHAQLAKDCLVVGDLPLCRVLLMNDSNYPWLILVPRRAGLRELYELEERDLMQFWNESATLGRLLMQRLGGDKLNVAALGNAVPQLHIHHIVRYRGDRAWPRPIWGVVAVNPYDEAVRELRVAEVRELLIASGLGLESQ